MNKYREKYEALQACRLSALQRLKYAAIAVVSVVVWWRALGFCLSFAILSEDVSGGALIVGGLGVVGLILILIVFFSRWYEAVIMAISGVRQLESEPESQ